MAGFVLFCTGEKGCRDPNGSRTDLKVCPYKFFPSFGIVTLMLHQPLYCQTGMSDPPAGRMNAIPTFVSLITQSPPPEAGLRAGFENIEVQNLPPGVGRFETCPYLKEPLSVKLATIVGDLRVFLKLSKPSYIDLLLFFPGKLHGQGVFYCLEFLFVNRCFIDKFKDVSPISAFHRRGDRILLT